MAYTSGKPRRKAGPGVTREIPSSDGWEELGEGPAVSSHLLGATASLPGLIAIPPVSLYPRCGPAFPRTAESTYEIAGQPLVEVAPSGL